MLDTYSQRFIYKNKFIHLTAIETDILEYLIDHRQRLANINEICRYVYGEPDIKYIRNLRVYIFRLQHKFKGILLITSRINIGYTIDYIGG